MAHLRPLGDTGLLVSPVGLGTVKFGRTEHLKYPRPFDLPDDDYLRALLRRALDLGVNLLDTAPAYGASEERLGALRPGGRGEWVIVTKCGEAFADGRSTFDFTPEAARRSVEGSLARLRTDYLDVVLVHSDGRDREILESFGTLEALADLKRRGLVRAAGVSTKSVEGGLLAVARCDVVMITLNPRDRAEAAVAKAAEAGRVGVLVKKALLSGHLDAQGLGGDPVETCLRFVLGCPGVSSAVIGTLSAAHLEQAVAAAMRLLEPDRDT